MRKAVHDKSGLLMKIISESKRLIISQFNLGDTEFILQLLNEELFIRYIADKNVRSHADAINYLTNGPILSYQNFGFGLNLVTLKDSALPIGMCGLLKREELEHPDLGFAFLSDFQGKGYAIEAAESVLNAEMSTYSLNTVLAVTLPGNLNSNRLLEKLGFHLKGKMRLHGKQNNLYQYLA